MRKNHRIFLRLVSFVLCLTVIMTIPIPISAETSTNNVMEKIASPLLDMETNSSEKDSRITKRILCELQNKRTENTKSFLLNDGNTLVAVYDQPIHFENKEGKWVEYDNTFVDSKDASDKGFMVNRSSNIDVKLAKESKDENLINIESDKLSISWAYDDVNQTDAKVMDDNAKRTNESSKTLLQNQESEILYENIYNNVDLQYFVTSTGVKENIILKNSNVQKEFHITYNAKGLTAKQADDRSIILCDNDDNEIAQIVAPYMIDAKGDISTQLNLKLVGQDGDAVNVSLIVDDDFIKSKGRAFPITVDPEIQMNLHNKIVYTSCTTDSNQVIGHPPYTLSANTCVVLSFNALPVLNNGERITCARLNMVMDNGADVVSSSNDEVIISAYKVDQLSSNEYSYINEVIDYDSLSCEDNVTASFDITKIFRDWYLSNSTENHILLKAVGLSDSDPIILAMPSKTAPIRPTLTYVYKDFTGTEGNLSYHSVAAGRNATASVSDYLGNLVINQPIYEEKGSKNPLSISVTYNSLNYDRTFENGSPSGKGWQFSYNQFIYETTGVLAEQGYNFVYCDSDGTDHYLKKDTNDNKWYDEDGLGLVLTPDTNQLVLENGGNEQTYQLPSAGGKLLNEKDEHNNTISYSYDSDGNLKTITDSSGGNAALTYTTLSSGDKRLSQISLPTGQDVFLYYSYNWILNYIFFSGDSASAFEYDTNGRLVVAAKRQYVPIYGRKVSFAYNNSGQVENITEYGSDGTEGKYLNIQYNNDNTTTFTDRNNRSATYTFDNDGSLISVLNPNGYISNGNDGLSLSGGAESFTKNYISQSSEFNAIGNNSASYYYKVNSSINGVCSIDNSLSYIGASSLTINNPVSNNNSAFFTSIAHLCNEMDFSESVKDITFSAYVKTNCINQIYDEGSVGACLRIEYPDPLGDDPIIIDSIGINGTEDWQRLSVSCSVPANTAEVYVYCMVRNASGTAWFDCLQLEEGNSASDFNALQNSDFSESGSWKNIDNQVVPTQNGTVILSGSPSVYDNDQTDVSETDATEAPEPEFETTIVTETETEPYGSVTTYDTYGNAIKIEQGTVTRQVRNTYRILPTVSPSESSTEPSTEPLIEPSTEPATEEGTSQVDNKPEFFGNNYIYQTVYIGRAGIKFNISGEAQAHSVPLTNENRTFGIALKLNYADSTSELHYQEFNAYTTHTQTVNLMVYPNEENKVVNTVDFAFVYSYNDNVMTVSNAMLNVALNSYSESDDPEPEPATGTTEPTVEPTDNRELIDSEVCTEVVNKSQLYMENSVEYDDTGRYVVTETDEFGNWIDYTYDSHGNLASIDDAIGNVTNYTYNSADKVTGVSCGNASNTYTYEPLSGNVLTITHNSFTYSFNYDVFDNLIQSKVGNVAVSSNTYDNHNGNLSRTDYANGDYITYTYDDYDNIIEIAGENGIIAQFVYNKKGLIAKCIDPQNSLTTYYYYDFEGNVTGEYRQSSDGSLSYYKTVDSSGNQIEKTSVNGQTKTVTSGTDSEGNSFVSYDGVTVDTSSDGFGRTEKVTTSQSNSSDSFTTNYDYAEGDGQHSTSHRVETVTQKYGENQLVEYEYEYNENGDVTEVYENGTIIAEYTYDSKNQLLTSAEKDTGLYKYYVYDNGGNLSEVLEYTLNPNNMRYGSFIITHTYSYGDTNWKDKLTAYDNTTLTYDANGNPLSYRDGMSFTWVNGRILDTVTVGNTTLSMKYDSNGLRTKKGSIKYYYDSSNNLIGMVNGNNTLLFYYDESGSPTSFSHNGTMYFYIKNLQGDICKIVDASGSVIANYTYDAWGKLLSVKDANGDSISNSTNVALLNPLRYRGYVYDDESGLYYLQSRYYDPTTCRFVNADILFDTQSGSPLSTNMFAYCENNVINTCDQSGNSVSRECGVNSFKIDGVVFRYSYNRKKAIDYARRHYRYSNPAFPLYDQDCTNFVSQCMYAGGIPQTKIWYCYQYHRPPARHRNSEAWSVASKNMQYVSKYLSKGSVKLKYESYNKDWKKILKNQKIQAGDIIYFSKNLGKSYYHAAIISFCDSYGIMYASHTIPYLFRSLAEFFKTYKKQGLIMVYKLK